MSMGTCYGYRIESSLSFDYLRPGTGDPLWVSETRPGLDVSEPGRLLLELPYRNQAGSTRIFEKNGSYNVWMGEGIWFLIDPTRPSVAMPSVLNPALGEAVLWGLPTALALLARGEIVLHAAAVEVKGQAILMAAPGGHGKTTLAAAMAAAGHRLLSEDLIRVRLGPQPVVFPGPAVIRLRHDVASWLKVPGTREATEDDEKVHLAVDPELRGDGCPVRLAGLVLLHHGDRQRLEAVAGQEMIKDLWSVSLNVPTPVGRARCFSQVFELAQAVPVWRVTRPLSRDALPGVVSLVASLAG